MQKSKKVWKGLWIRPPVPRNRRIPPKK